MSSPSILESAELVKVQCGQCGRIVRALAVAGVMGEQDLAGIGWRVDQRGKPVCDEHPAPVLYCDRCGQRRHGSSDPYLCRVCAPDQGALAEAYDTETVERLEALVKEGWRAGHLADAEAQLMGWMVTTLRDALARRSQEGK